MGACRSVGSVVDREVFHLLRAFLQLFNDIIGMGVDGLRTASTLGCWYTALRAGN
jgi:hypothetical protein